MTSVARDRQQRYAGPGKGGGERCEHTHGFEVEAGLDHQPSPGGGAFEDGDLVGRRPLGSDSGEFRVAADHGRKWTGRQHNGPLGCQEFDDEPPRQEA